MANKFGLPEKLVEAIEQQLRDPTKPFELISIDTENDEVVFSTSKDKKLRTRTLTSLFERINPKDYCPEPTCPYMEKKTFDVRHEPCIACLCIPEDEVQ